MNLDSLLPNLGEWLRGTGPESRHRHLHPHPPGPQPRRLPVHQPGQPRSRRPRSKPSARTPSPRPSCRQARLRQTSRRCRPLDRQFLVERQLISRELAAGRRPPRRRLRRRGDRQRHGQRGGPPAPPGHPQRLRPRRGLAATSTASTTCSKRSSPTPSARSSAT